MIEIHGIEEAVRGVVGQNICWCTFYDWDSGNEITRKTSSSVPSVGHRVDLDGVEYEVVSIFWRNFGYSADPDIRVRKCGEPH